MARFCCVDVLCYVVKLFKLFKDDLRSCFQGKSEEQFTALNGVIL